MSLTAVMHCPPDALRVLRRRTCIGVYLGDIVTNMYSTLNAPGSLICRCVLWVRSIGEQSLPLAASWQAFQKDSQWRLFPLIASTSHVNTPCPVVIFQDTQI